MRQQFQFSLARLLGAIPLAGLFSFAIRALFEAAQLGTSPDPRAFPLLAILGVGVMPAVIVGMLLRGEQGAILGGLYGISATIVALGVLAIIDTLDQGIRFYLGLFVTVLPAASGVLSWWRVGAMQREERELVACFLLTIIGVFLGLASSVIE